LKSLCGSDFAEGGFDDLFEIVFTGFDDAEFAFGVLGGVAGVGGVDHDGRAEFAADGAWRRLGRVGGTEDIADLVHSADTFVNEGDTFLGAGFLPLGLRNLTRRMAGHEADDIVELRVALHGAEDFAKGLLVGLGKLEAEFLLEDVLGLGADAILELGAEEFTDQGRRIPWPARCSWGVPGHRRWTSRCGRRSR